MGSPTYSHSSSPTDPGRAEPSRVIGWAFLQALKECILRLFTIPWSIWWGAALRLAERMNQTRQSRSESARSEFPVFDWMRASFDGVIFLLWFLFGAAALLTFLTTWVDGGSSNQFQPSRGGLEAALENFIGMVLSGYFSVIVVSLLKESTIIVFSIAHNVERIAQRR